jgi:hypothetical protein
MFSFKKFLIENLDDTVDPYVHGVANDMLKHPTYGKNPLTAMHGKDLINKGYEKHEEDRKKAGVRNTGLMQDASNTVVSIMGIEQRPQNKRILEQKAIEIVAKHTGFPKELMHAKLASNLLQSKYATMQQNQEGKQEIPDELKDEVHKRVNLSMLSQGHALVAMDGIYAEEKETIEAISPQLSDLYKKVSLITKGTYYHTNSIKQFVENPAVRRQGVVGEVYLDKNPENDTLEIYASAITFPFLVQELIKGVMEYTAQHSYHDMDEEKAKKVSGHATRFDDEPHQFLMGPQLWRYLVKCTPAKYQEKMMDVKFVLSLMPAKEVNDLLRHMVEDMVDSGSSPRTTQKIQDALDDLEEKRRQHEMGEDQDDDSEGWSPEEEDDDFSPDDFKPVRN